MTVYHAVAVGSDGYADLQGVRDMKVLLIGHACGPGLGSEPGNTWEFASRLSRQQKVWLIAHPQHRASVERALAATPYPNLQIVWVTTKSRLDSWKPDRGEAGIRFHYFLWLAEAYREARRLHHQIHFDLLHHVSWGTVGATPPLWKLDVPAVWGPLGGGQTTPKAFIPYFESGGRQERIRNLYTRLRKYSPSLRRCVRSAGLILATNRETATLLKDAGAENVRMFLDCGLFEQPDVQSPRTAAANRTCTFLWAGRLEHRKGLALALEAFARVRRLPVKLLIAGKGPSRDSYEEKMRALELEHTVQFLGPVAYERMPALFRGADAFVFTSLRDSFGSVVLEAMSYGLPIVSLDHQGVGAFVPDAAGIKVPVSTPAEVVEALAAAIEKIARCTPCRLVMGAAALERARQETWAYRVARLTSLYDEVISAHRRV